MFRGNQRIFFHLSTLVSNQMTAEITVSLKLARGNHEQRIEKQNFNVKLLPPFLLLHETMLKNSEKIFRRSDLPKCSAFPLFFVCKKQLFFIPSLHQQNITFVLTMSLANKYEVEKIDLNVQISVIILASSTRQFHFCFAILCFASLQRGKIRLRRPNCFFFV